jgi:hypothetical protein
MMYASNLRMACVEPLQPLATYILVANEAKSESESSRAASANANLFGHFDIRRRRRREANAC